MYSFYFGHSPIPNKEKILRRLLLFTIVPVVVITLAMTSVIGSPSVTKTNREAAVKAATSDCEPVPARCGQDQWAGLETALTAIRDYELALFYNSLQNRSAGDTNTQRSSGGCGVREPLYKEGNQFGGSAIPENIVARESGGNYNSCNKSSTASGRYQVLDSTWAGYGGYARAVDAPMDVQDAWAAEAWAAAGCRPWGCP